MVLEKQVKEYSDRQRINLNKADGFNANDTVYILSEQKKLIKITCQMYIKYIKKR